LNPSADTDKVGLEIATVLRRGSSGISMSPDRYGSGATRIEADLSINRGENLMRRASTCLALLGLAVLGLPAVASAAPTVTLVAKAVPIPGFPGTGNILGAGTAIEFKATIKGTESTGGVPSQITGVTVYAPAGTKVNQSGFVTCAPATLENIGPSGCPKKSQASPIGSAGVVDPIGGELVKENATVQAFSAQLLVATGNYSAASAPYGLKFTSAVKIVESVPGAPPVSTESINLEVGAAFKKGKKTVSYFTVPKKCPKGGFPLKTEITFATGETSTAEFKAPCPKR
jgi:hypothetical protein